MLRRNKRGEKQPGAGPAASLIGIILLIFIFYVILIPPAERARILEGTSVDDPRIPTSSSFPEAQNVLLAERIGSMSYVPEDDVEHAIPNVQLMESAEAEVLASLNPFEVSKGAFGESTKELRFPLDPLKVKNVFLSLQAPIRNGVLKITLNGFDLFEQEITSPTPPVITIPSSMLMENNVMTFEVGGGLFDDKRYALADVKIIGDVFDVSSQTASNSFVLSRGEFENVERARMMFFVECFQRDVGNLEIILNGKGIYSAVPVCDALNQVDLFKQDFRADRNNLVFRLESGGILVETIRLETQLAESKPFIGFFELEEDIFEDIEQGHREAFLKVEFVDDAEDKVADININGVLSVIDQDEDTFALDISERVKSGNNYIELTPRTDLNIVELIVEYR